MAVNNCHFGYSAVIRILQRFKFTDAAKEICVAHLLLLRQLFYFPDLTIKDYVPPDRNLPERNLQTSPVTPRHAQICRNSLGLEQIIPLRRRTEYPTLWPHCLIHLRCKPLRLDERPTPRCAGPLH